MAIQALIADDHELFRCGLMQLLLDEFDVSEVFEAASFEQALEVLAAHGPGDLVLIDLGMPGMSGAETLAALRDGFPEAKVAVVSGSEERADIIAALSVGVHGYIPKSLPAKEMAAALKSVLEGRIFAPSAIGRRDTFPERSQIPCRQTGEFTGRQRQVLKELLSGQASKEIARTLGIAESTVKIHLAAIYRVLGVRTRAEAIAKSGSNRLLR